MVEKRILTPSRVRQPPKNGFSWVDRRFVHDHAAALSRDAVLLYFFLAAVSDRNGLSFWSDTAIAGRLKLEESGVVRARNELIVRDLVSYDAPFTQVLSLPSRDQRATGEALPIKTLLPWPANGRSQTGKAPRLKLTGDAP